MPGTKKGDYFFCLPSPNIMLLTHVLSNVKINFEEALGTLWKSLIFDPLLAEINRFLSTLWENLCVFKAVHICHQQPERLRQVSSLLTFDTFTGFEYNFCKKYNCTSTDGVWGSSDAQTVWKASWQESCHGLPCYVHRPVCAAPQYQQPFKNKGKTN